MIKQSLDDAYLDGILMSILKEIVDWAVTQDDWKQDAVRRVIKGGNFSESDVFELSEFLLHKYGYIESYSDESKIKPINKDEFSSPESFAKRKVVLKKMESLQNVNALNSDAKLQFAMDGLTIIYGENGTGKSGYVRILKKCCKARNIDNVFPNVFVESVKGASSAKLFYSVDTQDFEHKWTDDGSSIEALEELVVFDNKCGKIQVTDKNELIYLPHGTDIFKKLIELIVEIKKEVDKNRPKEKKINLEKIDVNSPSYKYIQMINKTSKKEDVKSALKWGSEEESSLIEISKKILEANEEEVNKKVVKINKEIKNLKLLQTTVLILEKSSTPEKITNIYNLIKSKDEAKKALDKITNDMQGNNILEGTGRELWRVMYDAAKEFSINCAHSEKEFPYVEGTCVLCQQTLDEEAKERFQTFSKFAEGKVKRSFDDIVTKINTAEKFLNDLKSEINKVKNILNLEFNCMDDDNKRKITSHLELLDGIRQDLIKILTQGKDDSLSIETLGQTLEPTIIAYIENTTLEKSEIEKSVDPENLKRLKKNKTDLNSLKIANSRINEILDYSSYLNELENFNKMIKETDHGPISKKGSTIITNSLKDSFLKSLSIELSNLGGKEIPLFLNSSTRLGKPTFQLSLKGANISPQCKLDTILSEGEQKIASLAGLLAELDTAKHANGLILDDPVTSLDHQFQKKIAKRLIEEARNRQIIIFTHDIAFLFDLQFYAKELEVPTHTQNIRKEGISSGVIFNSNPWHAQDVKSRLKTIRGNIDTLSKESLEKENYNHRAGAIYGRLRETWERAVEEVLFNEVVTRFGQDIQTKRLNGVFVDDDDFSLIYFEMRKCSENIVGHDKSLSLSDDRPSIKDMRKDIDLISTFIKKINARKNKVIKNRKNRVEAPPEAEVVE